MVRIRPFRGIRPARGKEALVAALPYDVYSREEAKRAVEGKPLSFLRIDRAETQLSEEVDTCDPRVYEKAKELLEDMEERGDFVQDPVPCCYLYELTMNGRSQTGIVACASVQHPDRSYFPGLPESVGLEEADGKGEGAGAAVFLCVGGWNWTQGMDDPRFGHASMYSEGF